MRKFVSWITFGWLCKPPKAVEDDPKHISPIATNPHLVTAENVCDVAVGTPTYSDRFVCIVKSRFSGQTKFSLDDWAEYQMYNSVFNGDLTDFNYINLDVPKELTKYGLIPIVFEMHLREPITDPSRIKRLLAWSERARKEYLNVKETVSIYVRIRQFTPVYFDADHKIELGFRYAFPLDFDGSNKITMVGYTNHDTRDTKTKCPKGQ
jgi:hypothetical protein